MSRDWQLDMERCKELTSVGRDNVHVKALEYWLQQYAEAKEERDELQSLAENFNADIRHLEQQVESLEREWRRTKYQLHESKDKENKLREAIEKSLNIYWEVTIDDDESLLKMSEILGDVLASLYPKEETKPAVLEEGETK